MAASRDLPFPLAILCLVLIRGLASLPTTSGVPATNPKAPIDDDYDPYAEPLTTTTPPKLPGGPLKRCDYDECLEGEVPCLEQAAATHCLCPGYTVHNQVPHAPRIKSVSWNGSEVVVMWCAPASFISGYVVTVGGEDKQSFGENRRKGGVGTIKQISEVCVAAVNDAGESKQSCLMYRPQDSTLPLMAGLIGGALGLLLLLLLAVLLWRRRRQRKQQASISMHDTAGRQ